MKKIVILIPMILASWASSVYSQITFQNVSAAAGITSQNFNYGVSFNDVDGDGLPDIYTVYTIGGGLCHRGESSIITTATALLR